MTAVSAEQCVATDGLIQPDKIPGAASSDNTGGQLNAAAINDACQQARNVANKVRTGVTDVNSAWTVLPAVFEMPGAETVHNAMSTPSTSLITFAGKLDSMARALEDFADAIEPLRISFDEVRVRAQEFVDSLEPGNKVWMRASSTTEYQFNGDASPRSSYTSSGYSTGSYSTSHSAYGTSSGSSADSTAYTASDAAAYLRGRGETARVSGGTVEILVTWLESGEHVGRNNDLMDEVADLYARLHAAEVDCANRINALREDVCIAPLEAVEAWQLKQDGVEMPWGSRVEEKRNCGEQVGNGFVEFGKGTVEGLGSLVSYNYMTGEMWDWDHAGQSWAGIGDIVVSISTLGGGALGLINVAINGPSAYTDSLETVTELGKSLVAWDTWEDAPAQAATETILNIGTAFIPVGGWALAGTKALSAAAGATRITSALTKLDNLGPSVMARLGGGDFKIDVNVNVDVDAPTIRVDADAPVIRPDADTPHADADVPANPGGLADDAGRASDNAGPGDAPSKPDEAPGTPGSGAVDDAVRASDDTSDGNVSGKGDDAQGGPGGGAADEAVREGDNAGPVDGGGPNDGAPPPQAPPPPDKPSDAVIRDFAESKGLSNEQLHDLRRTPAEDLTPTQIETLKELRETIPAPTETTPLVKVMPLGDVQKYLSGDYQNVQGFVARASDVDPQAGLSRVVDDLRLDYTPGEGRTNPFTDPNAEGYGYIEFTTPDAHVLDTPYSPQFGGDVEMGQPFAGSGFTLNNDSVWRPEYHVPRDALPMSLNEGAKLWQVGPDGPRLVAEFKVDVGWVAQ